MSKILKKWNNIMNKLLKTKKIYLLMLTKKLIIKLFYKDKMRIR